MNIFWIRTGSFRLPFVKDNHSQIKQLQSFVTRKMRRKCPGEKMKSELGKSRRDGKLPPPPGCCLLTGVPFCSGTRGVRTPWKPRGVVPLARTAPAGLRPPMLRARLCRMCSKLPREAQPRRASVASEPGFLLTHINTAQMCSRRAKSPLPTHMFLLGSWLTSNPVA